MASVSTDPRGYRFIQFMDANGRRRTIRVGKITLKAAEEIRAKIEHINAAKISGYAPDGALLNWITEIGDALHTRLVAVGLARPREKAADVVRLAEFIDAYIARRTDVRPNTLRNLRDSQARLVEFLGADKPLAEITPADGDHFLLWLKERYADGTAGRTVKRAKQFFKAAIRARHIAENPFTDVKPPSQLNASRKHFVSQADAEAVLAACPDVQWRTIFALARFGGLRVPSEATALTWEDVDWEKGRVRITSPKTARYAGKAQRIIPLFPRLRAVLADAFDQAEPGTRHVVTRCRDSAVNLRTGLLRIIKRAGVEPWEKLFVNLRSSCETELSAVHPIHVVVSWLGHTQAVAMAHYLQVVESDFEKANGPECAAESAAPALQNALRKPAEVNGNGGNALPEDVPGSDIMPAVSRQFPSVQCTSIPPREVEHTPVFSGDLEETAFRAAPLGAVSDPDLARLVTSWPDLPAAVRRRILALLPPS